MRRRDAVPTAHRVPLAGALAWSRRLRAARSSVPRGRATATPAGAELFNERCSGCHTLEARRTPTARSRAGELQGGERTNGPNFNVRKESRDDVLFAIRNGGFSGAIMPANIVVGEDAEDVADFLDAVLGRDAAARTTSTASGRRG